VDEMGDICSDCVRVNMRGNRVGISRLTIVAPNVILLSLVKI